MSCEIVYSPLAESDLDRVWDEVYEASQDFDITDKYIDDIRDKVRKKKKIPKTGTPLIFMGELTGIYYVTFKEYIAFYRILDDVIEVSRVLYAKCDYMKVLFGKSGYTLEDAEE